MNHTELQKRTRTAMETVCFKKGFVQVPDVLLEIGVLSPADYESWRKGRIPYLEKVLHVSLPKSNAIIREMKSCAAEKGWKASLTVFKQQKGNRILRFSKSGNPNIEKAFQTVYVDQKRTEELKQKRKEKEQH